MSVRSPALLLLNSISLYENTLNLFIFLAVDGHLGYFQGLIIMNKSAMTFIYISL